MISIRKLKKYTPTKFANTDSTYNKRMADSAVCFINCLKHTKGEWYGQPFDLIDWQEQIVRDIFGILKPNGYRQFNTAYIEIPKKQGKQLSLNTLIPTPGGYTTMGKISVGDDVFDENGNICQVVAKSNIDCSEQAYRITFKDGEIIEAGANHEWCGQYTHGKPVFCIMTTEELLNLPKDGNSLRFRIPIAKYLKLNEASLPISPYLMGYWLGNGNAIKPEITIKTEDISGVLKNIVYRNEISGIWHNIGDSVVVRIPDLNKILLKTFHDKKIPLKYLRSSKQQRIELLRGLMDSDGCIEKIRGQAVYCSTERGLARSVSELLWSLGIKNTITKAASTQRKDWNKRSRECGRVKTGEMLYYIKFTAFKDTRISGLYRKYKNSVERNPRTRSHFRYIDKIEKIQNRGMQCIQVNSPSHQYLVGRSCLPTHNSELAAATALLLTCGDFEHGGEVYGPASDRQQASIVFDVAVDMVGGCPALKSRIKPVLSQKRLIYKPLNSFYQVLSAEAYTKHGLNVHGVVFDELHAQPNRNLYDVMLHGSGDARKQPLFFLITTAGTDRNSVCWEVHQKAEDILKGRKRDPTFYPVIYGAPSDADWTSEEVWRAANPSLGITVDIEKLKNACESARQNTAEENLFRQLRLNQWVKQSVRWMPMEKWDACSFKFNERDLEGRVCYGGLDLSSTTDITAFVLVFPPSSSQSPLNSVFVSNENCTRSLAPPFPTKSSDFAGTPYLNDKYYILPYFWIPEDNLDLRVRRDHVPYDIWHQEGHLQTTEGNVVHYGFIENFIEELGTKYNIREIAFDRWGAVQMVQNLEGMGFTVVPFGQGFKDMSPPSKELMKLTLEGKLAHTGHPVLHWMMDNIFIRTDPAGNIKPDKEKSTEKIDGAVATIMALDRAIRNQNTQTDSVYNERGLIII